MLALLYKRTSKERGKGNSPTPNNLSLYTLCLPPSNHPSFMLWCTIRISNHDPTHHQNSSYQYNHTTSSNVTTPQPTSLSKEIIPPPCRNILMPFPHPSTSWSFRNTNSFRPPDTIPRYTTIHSSQPELWQYPPTRLEVLWEHFPKVLASRGIVDETPPPLVNHPRISQVPRSKNHTQSNVWDTVTGFDTSDYLQHLKPHTPLHHQLPPKVAVLIVVLQGDHPPQDPEGKQVVLDEAILTHATLVHMHMGIFGEPP